jgi:chromate reductase, NAD(P)H dehydrogenase (quinone)
MKKITLFAFAGSTRKESYNKKLLRVAVRAAEQAGAEVKTFDLADYPMPLYDGDLEAERGLPEKAIALKHELAAADALLIASPEYNGSLSAVLKNTIDWLSRPGAVEGSVYQGKTALIISASPGRLGGLRGLNHLREILTNLGVFVLPGQRAVSEAHKVFNEASEMVDEDTKAQVEKLVFGLVETAERLR